MLKELLALFRLRMEIILANKSLLLQLFLPLILIALYQFMFNRDGNMGLMVLVMSLGVVHSINGQLISLIMAEEQEKHNLRSLQLVGMKSWQYLLANAILPILMTVIYVVGLPIYLSVDLKGYWLTYILVNTLTSLVILLLYMIIGVTCDTQSKATVAGLPVMLLAMLLPMLSLGDTGIEKFARYSFMAAYVEWMKVYGEMAPTDKSLLVTLAWLVGLAVCAFLVLRKSRLNR